MNKKKLTWITATRMNEQNNQKEKRGERITKWYNPPVLLRNPGIKAEMKSCRIYPWFIFYKTRTEKKEDIHFWTVLYHKHALREY